MTQQPARLMRLLSPGVRAQPVEFLHTLRVEIGIAFFHRQEKLFGQYRANRVDGFMPVEPFLHQSQKNSTRRECISEGHLILDDHVGSGVKALVGKRDLIPLVVLPDRFDSRGFIERLPSFRIDVQFGIVTQDYRLTFFDRGDGVRRGCRHIRAAGHHAVGR